MDKKYELTDITKTVLLGDVERRTVVLHRIIALIDFGDVKKGDLGGWVENENVLSHEDECWIGDNAEVYRDGIVCDNAQVYSNAKVIAGRVCGNAEVSGHAKISDATIGGNSEVFGYATVANYVTVCGNARIFDHAFLYGYVEVSDEAEVYGGTTIYDNAKIYGNAIVCDQAKVDHNAKIGGSSYVNGSSKIGQNACIENTSDYMVYGPVGSRQDHTTFYKGGDEIYVRTGCFRGTLKEFKNAVKKKHKFNSVHRKDYMKIIRFAKKKLK